MTKIEMFNALLSLVANSSVADKDELTDKLNNEIELLKKKAATPRKPSATQVENESLKGDILSFLAANNSMFTIKELQEKIPTLSALSNQRISHLLTALGEKGEKLVTKTYIKKVAHFSKAV